MGKGKKTDCFQKKLDGCVLSVPNPARPIYTGAGGADLPWERDGNWRISFARQPAAGSRVDAPCTLGLKPCPEAHARLEEKLWLVFSSRPSRNWMDHSRSTIEQHAFAGRSCDYVLRHA